MKKLVVCLLAVALLSGCGSGSSKKLSKTCSMDYSGIIIEMTAEAKDPKSKIDAVNITYTAPFEIFGVDKAKLTDEVKDLMVSSLETQMKEQIGDAKIETKFTDNELIVSAELDADTIESQGLNELTVLKFVDNMEDANATCK